MTVRPARRADVAAVTALWQALLDAHAALDPALAPHPDLARALPGAAKRLLDDADAALWVYEDAGGVRGFCAVRLARSPAAVEGRCAEITELIVAPAVRRRGAGSALAEAALSWASARRAARVEVRAAARNPEAQAFWRALGFGDFMDVLDRRL